RTCSHALRQRAATTTRPPNCSRRPPTATRKPAQPRSHSATDARATRSLTPPSNAHSDLVRDSQRLEHPRRRDAKVALAGRNTTEASTAARDAVGEIASIGAETSAQQGGHLPNCSPASAPL